MSSKNMARTVIECGKDIDYKRQRRESNRNERHRGRRYCLALQSDPCLFDEMPHPRSARLRPDFDDKLNALELWLDSFDGQRWNDLWSLIRKRFDTRTTPGRHIVEGHIIDDITFFGEGNHEERSVYLHRVDENGIFHKPVSRQPYRWDKGKPESEIVAWLKCRSVGKRGSKFYWFNAENGRQEHELNADELAFFSEMNAMQQREILTRSPISCERKFKRAHQCKDHYLWDKERTDPVWIPKERQIKDWWRAMISFRDEDGGKVLGICRFCQIEEVLED